MAKVLTARLVSLLDGLRVMPALVGDLPNGGEDVMAAWMDCRCISLYLQGDGCTSE